MPTKSQPRTSMLSRINISLSPNSLQRQWLQSQMLLKVCVHGLSILSSTMMSFRMLNRNVRHWRKRLNSLKKLLPNSTKSMKLSASSTKNFRSWLMNLTKLLLKRMGQLVRFKLYFFKFIKFILTKSWGWEMCSKIKPSPEISHCSVKWEWTLGQINCDARWIIEADGRRRTHCIIFCQLLWSLQ